GGDRLRDGVRDRRGRLRQRHGGDAVGDGGGGGVDVRGLEWRGRLGDEPVHGDHEYGHDGDGDLRRAAVHADGREGGDGERHGDLEPGRDHLRGDLRSRLGRLRQRHGGDADGDGGGRVDVRGLEWRGLLGDEPVHGDDEYGHDGDGDLQRAAVHARGRQGGDGERHGDLEPRRDHLRDGLLDRL